MTMEKAMPIAAMPIAAMPIADRKWTVLFIGGASGTGKSSLAYQLARFYQVNVLEIDDIHQAIKAMTTGAVLPAIHYWSTGVNWMEIGVEGNVNWLKDVSREMIPGLRAIAENHLEAGVPVIMEGDFVDPEFVASFNDSSVKALFVHEPDKNQILDNYLAREGGELQHFRADISIVYGKSLTDACGRLEIPWIEARPWETALARAIRLLL